MQRYNDAQNRKCLRGSSLLLCTLSLIAVAPLTAAQQGSPAEQKPSKPSSAVPNPSTPSAQPQQPLAPTETDGSDWTRWTGGRYRITPGDVIELRFPFVPELDQTLAVQPDGYVTLREHGDMRVQGRTVPELRIQLLEAYEPIVREPVFTVVLREFEKPYFVAAGEITRPGRYDLRGATTLTQALAYAGGLTSAGKSSEVVLFRNHTEDTVSVKQIDVKKMYDKRNLSEDPLLQPGDTVYIPKSLLGKLQPILSKFSFGW